MKIGQKLGWSIAISRTRLGAQTDASEMTLPDGGKNVASKQALSISTFCCMYPYCILGTIPLFSYQSLVHVHIIYLTLLSLCLADTLDMYNNWLQLWAGEKSNERTLNWGSRKHAVVIRKCVIWILFPIAVQSILERGGEISHAVDKNRSSTLREC